MRHRTARPLPLLLGVLIGSLLCACSNSDGVDYANYAEIIANSEGFWNTKVDHLSLDDWEYPYAGIPRIVIETVNHLPIRDRETEVPAKLQIWGDVPESEVMNLTIRGRGNTSWTEMPKKSYKIEFVNKQEMLGMPKDRDWALISNYADKTLMRNYLAYHLSAKLGAYYAPRCEFAEFFLNGEYLGVYLLTETIKNGKFRVNIPNGTSFFIAEITKNKQQNDQLIYSHILKNDSTGTQFKIHRPKNASTESLLLIKDKIETFEKYLRTIKERQNNNIDAQLNLDEYVKYYWVQEFTKNPDAQDWSSIFFSWQNGESIKMGPVWDFDLAFGNHSATTNNSPENFYIKKGYWHSFILKDSLACHAVIDFWKNNHDKFDKTVHDADSIYATLQKASQNNFKRWNILKNTEYVYHRKSFNHDKEAVEDLKNWIQTRIQWIDNHI